MNYRNDDFVARIGIDVDGVLRNLMPNINKVFQTYYPSHVRGNVAYNWDFPQFDLPLKKKYEIIFNEYPEYIFLKSKPYSGVFDEFVQLKQWAKERRFKLVCATTQESHIVDMTYLWLGKWGFTFDELHITKDKSNIGLDYLIDDGPPNYDSWIKRGNKEENFFLVDRDWNQNVGASRRIKSIIDILKFEL